MTRRPRISRAIWLVVGLFALAVFGVAALLLHEIERQADAVAREQAERLARGVEVDLNGNLLGVDLMLAGLEQMPDLLGQGGNLVDAAKAPAILHALSNQSLSARNLMLLDAAGKVIVAADPATTRLGARLPPGFLTAVLSERAPQMLISTPVTNFRSGEKVLYFARPLVGPRHDRLVAAAEVPVSVLTTMMAPSVEIAGLTITLENEQGMLLASVPANDSMLGRRSAAPLDPRLANGTATLGRGRIDGALSYLSVRPTVYGSVLVAAGISQAAVLAQSNELRYAVAAIALVFIVLAIAAGLLAQNDLGRLTAANAETDRARSVLEEALASMDEGFLLWTADDRVVSWNARYLEFFPHLRSMIGPGIDISAMAEAGADALLPGADPQRRQAWVAERLAMHYSDGKEFEQHTREGRIVSSVERRTATGGIVSIYRDVTRERAVAGELERARRAAEAANAAKTRFLATMSHEIRTPLNGVLGMNALLLKTPLNTTQREYAQTIRGCGESLLAIINDILDMSRLEAGALALEPVAIRPSKLVDEVVGLLGARAAEKGIAIAFDCAADAPLLLGDPVRLRQVLFNLVGNAIKFTDRGGVSVAERYQPLADGHVDWIVTVRDTGIGIPAAALPTLFDHFTQADSSTSRRFGGSGLGLAICQQLLGLMGGRIDLTSRVGEGSEFVVRVPLARATLPQSPSPAAGRAAPAAGSPLRVLVAEDNEVNQALMVAMLEQMGHATDVVADGQAAVRKAQDQRYDLVLMDIQMPVMDGEAAARAIRELPGEAGRVPIIAVTANALPEQRAAYLAAGMNEHLAKPFDLDRLSAAIAEVTGAA